MNQKSAALTFVLLLGLVSLCADATHEGARSITGAYLQTLGATGAIVGLVAGLGELIGYRNRQKHKGRGQKEMLSRQGRWRSQLVLTLLSAAICLAPGCGVFE